jgi:hypothetical protein
VHCSLTLSLSCIQCSKHFSKHTGLLVSVQHVRSGNAALHALHKDSISGQQVGVQELQERCNIKLYKRSNTSAIMWLNALDAGMHAMVLLSASDPVTSTVCSTMRLLPAVHTHTLQQVYMSHHSAMLVVMSVHEYCVTAVCHRCVLLLLLQHCNSHCQAH